MTTDTAISVILNGEEVSLGGGASVADLLRAEGRDVRQPGIAVAVNDRVVRRAEWESTILGHGDQVEVITAFQGG
jgi:sulfur carrier protein